MTPRGSGEWPRRIRAAAGALLLVWTGCLAGCLSTGEVPPGTEITLLVVAPDPESGRSKLSKAVLTTVRDLRHLSGDAVHMTAGADIRLDFDALARSRPQTAQQLEAQTIGARGRDVDFFWFEVDGVIHPQDFHSLSLATTYYNFERAHLFFADLNAPLYELPLEYFPDLTEVRGGRTSTPADNAYWDPILRMFVVLPFREQLALPLGMNPGVVAHEFAHAVFSQRVFNDDGLPWLHARYLADPDRYSMAMNLVRAINEGIADYMGAAVSGDPDFLRHSLPDLSEVRRLDVESPRCLTPELRESIDVTPHADFDPYGPGSVLAAALWEIRESSPGEARALSGAVTDALLDMGDALRAADDRPQLPLLLDSLTSRIPLTLLPVACGILLDRFRLSASDLAACAESTPPSASCGEF